MTKLDSKWLKGIFSLVLIVGLLGSPAPALSQDDASIRDIIVNGGFEEGFQDGFGVAFGWGGFSNGEAVVGWGADTWDKVVVAGQTAQMIEIKNATNRDRFAGIYQTVSVVPGQQYKLTINGLVRSEEGDLTVSDYGYRLQYAIDPDGGTAWELLGDAAWIELNWDEQPLAAPPEGGYRHGSFETTVTATGDRLTLFIRGWKKWLNNGSGIFDLDEISLVGPAPAGVDVPEVQTASVGGAAQTDDATSISNDAAVQSEHGANIESEPAEVEEPAAQPDATESESVPQSEDTSGTTAPQDEAAPAQPDTSQPTPSAPDNTSTQLPVSGRGEDGSIKFVIMSGAALLLILFAGAIVATVKQRNPVE
jgi:hypothetical protein